MRVQMEINIHIWLVACKRSSSTYGTFLPASTHAVSSLKAYAHPFYDDNSGVSVRDYEQSHKATGGRELILPEHL